MSNGTNQNCGPNCKDCSNLPPNCIPFGQCQVDFPAQMTTNLGFNISATLCTDDPDVQGLCICCEDTIGVCVTVDMTSSDSPLAYMLCGNWRICLEVRSTSGDPVNWKDNCVIQFDSCTAQEWQAGFVIPKGVIPCDPGDCGETVYAIVKVMALDCNCNPIGIVGECELENIYVYPCPTVRKMRDRSKKAAPAK
ncbi:MAG TPA: hypothetical protein VMU33_19695 [Burkholderiaceae bacterium]|nr:hypothetical protein [Burkholderiaceae bacterium]